MKTVLITGGCGFIGSALVRRCVRLGYRVVNVDALLYAGNPDSVREVADSGHYVFEHVDIRDEARMRGILARYRPEVVFHLAAQTHVDRSIEEPKAFVSVNVDGTYALLEAVRSYWTGLSKKERDAFRFLHVSTDEVYGDLAPEAPPAKEGDAYRPSSPYAASKAASDHLVRAWHRTYGLPVLVTNCTNNYGPYQFPEKLIPLMILKALAGERLPVYGDGSQVRDWLFVEDHVAALIGVAERGRVGETYHVASGVQKRNIEVVHAICDVLEALVPEKPEGVGRYRDLIAFVEDRPGHDRRYALDAGKIERELGWRASVGFEEGIKRTVRWYLDNRWWWQPILERRYRLQRLGVVKG